MEQKKEIEEIKEKIESLDKNLETLSSAVLEQSDSSKECEEVLERGPVCEDGYRAFVGQRKYAMCRAFKALETDEVKSFGDGIRLAWKEVREICNPSSDGE